MSLNAWIGTVIAWAREIAEICVLVPLAIWLWYEKAKPWIDQQRSSATEDESAQGESITPRDGF